MDFLKNISQRNTFRLIILFELLFYLDSYFDLCHFIQNIRLFKINNPGLLGLIHVLYPESWTLILLITGAISCVLFLANSNKKLAWLLKQISLIGLLFLQMSRYFILILFIIFYSLNDISSEYFEISKQEKRTVYILSILTTIIFLILIYNDISLFEYHYN